MNENNKDWVTVKIYGVYKQPGFITIELSKSELIEGNSIEIENHSYIIASVILDSPQHYTINVNIQR